MLAFLVVSQHLSVRLMGRAETQRPFLCLVPTRQQHEDAGRKAGRKAARGGVRNTDALTRIPYAGTSLREPERYAPGACAAIMDAVEKLV